MKVVVTKVTSGETVALNLEDIRRVTPISSTQKGDSHDACQVMFKGDSFILKVAIKFETLVALMIDSKVNAEWVCCEDGTVTLYTPS